jgi:hypothetical protein
MDFAEGIRLLQELGARPDALYWEGFPHEENVLATLRLVQQVCGREGRGGGVRVCVYAPAALDADVHQAYTHTQTYVPPLASQHDIPTYTSLRITHTYIYTRHM